MSRPSITQPDNPTLGILLMVATTFVFALQDGISRHLAAEYNTLMVVMIRYWFFAAFVIAIARRQAGEPQNLAELRQAMDLDRREVEELGHQVEDRQAKIDALRADLTAAEEAFHRVQEPLEDLRQQLDDARHVRVRRRCR